VERLAIYSLLPNTEANAVLPQGVVVVIKEPYYKRTADGGLFVRVDHPTDIVRLKPGNNIIPASLTARTPRTIPSAIRLKEIGNAAFKRGDFEAAFDLYSDALEALIRNGDWLRQDLQPNRAGANLRLGCNGLALTDALALVIAVENNLKTVKDVNTKAFFRAGKAAYAMQDFASVTRRPLTRGLMKIKELIYGYRHRT
jgi:hypothetical protein